MKELFAQAPKFIRDRFYGIRSYVWFTLFPADEYERKIRRLTRENKRKYRDNVNELVDEASIALFIFFIQKFLKQGTEIAQKAADVYTSLNLEGFWIGREKYEGRNENVMMGEKLANILLNNISQNLKKIIEEADQPYEIINLYKIKIREI